MIDQSPTGQAIFKLPTWAHVLVSMVVVAAGAVPDIAGAPEWLQTAGRTVAFLGAVLLGSTPGLRKRAP